MIGGDVASTTFVVVRRRRVADVPKMAFDGRQHHYGRRGRIVTDRKWAEGRG
jgi:hypothetical protein